MTATTPNITFFERAAPLSLALIVAAAAVLYAGALPAAALACAERAAPLSTPLALIVAAAALALMRTLVRTVITPAGFGAHCGGSIDAGAALHFPGWLCVLLGGFSCVRKGLGANGVWASRLVLVAAIILPSYCSAQSITVRTLAGNGNAAIGGNSARATGTAALFDAPGGVSVDSASENVFVADTGNHCIRKVAIVNGVVTTLAGSRDFVGRADATGAAASFNVPNDLAVRNDGTLFVADRGNSIVRKVTPGGVVSTFATGFSSPRGIAVDADTVLLR